MKYPIHAKSIIALLIITASLSSCTKLKSTSHLGNEDLNLHSNANDNTQELAADDPQVETSPNSKPKQIGPVDNVFVHSMDKFITAFELVKAAKTSIDIEIYEMDDPRFHVEVLRALARGVKIRIIKDPRPYENNPNKPSTCFWFEEPREGEDCKHERAFVKAFREGGGTLVPFMKNELCGQDNDTDSRSKSKCFQHGKMMIIDQRAVLVSTGNFDNSNFCNIAANPSRCNRDFTVISRDADVVRTISTVFENDLKAKQYALAPIVTGAINYKMTVSPYTLAPIVGFIQSAKTSIKIDHQYMNHPVVNEAIVAAAKSGVKVQLLLTSLCAFDRPDAKEIEKSTKLYTAYDALGIQTRFFSDSILIKGIKGYNHSKLFIVDDKAAWVGSTNGSVGAFDRNREFGIFLQNPEAIQKLVATFNADFSNPLSESWKESLVCARTTPRNQ